MPVKPRARCPHEGVAIATHCATVILNLPRSKLQKNPRAHKNKIGTSPPPPPNPKYPPPPKTRNFMDMVFPAEWTHFFQASIKLAHPFPAPELRTIIFFGGNKRDKLKGTNARDSQFFVDFRRFLQIFAFPGNCSISGCADFRRETADFRRNPFVPFSLCLLVPPHEDFSENLLSRGIFNTAGSFPEGLSTWVHQNRAILCGCGSDFNRSPKNRATFRGPKMRDFLCEENR